MAAGAAFGGASDDLDIGPDEMNIWVAAGDGDVEFLRKALESGISPVVQDENGYTPVHAAASWGQLDALRILLEAGADVNVTDPDGDTPLHVVGSVECARLLLEAGATLDAANSEGVLPLTALSEDGDSGVIEYLVEVHKERGMPLPPMLSGDGAEDEWDDGVAEDADIEEEK